MEKVYDLLLRSGNWTLAHLDSIALALVATLLVVYGDKLNAFVKKQLRPYPRLLRILGFVLMCAFGYGALTVFLTPFVADLLGALPVKWLGLAVLALFLLVGSLAENRRQI